MKKVYLVIAVYILVVGCSSGGSSDGTPECGPNASCAAPRQTPDASIVAVSYTHLTLPTTPYV